MKPAEIVSIVMAQFIEAHQKHGRRVIWPPEFNHFIAGSSTQEVRVENAPPSDPTNNDDRLS